MPNLTNIVRNGRLLMHKIPAVHKILQSVGIAKVFRKRYYSRILQGKVHEAIIFGKPLLFAVESEADISILDIFTHLESHFVPRLLDAIQVGDVIFDVGANLGQTSINIASSASNKDIRVHAFEPDPSNARKLSQSIELNGMSDIVNLHEIAISDLDGTCLLYMGCDPGIHSLIAGTCGEVEVACATAGTIAEKIGSVPDILKIDVEGAEMKVLAGASDLLRQKLIRDIFVEIHPTVCSDLTLHNMPYSKWLSDAGYTLQWSDDRCSEIHQHWMRK